MKNRFATVLFLLLLLLSPVFVRGQASPALVLKTRIALPNAKGRMDHLGVDLKANVFLLPRLTTIPWK